MRSGYDILEGYFMPTTTRPRIQTIRSPKLRVKISVAKEHQKMARENALQEIAGILEDQMTDLGLSEKEKNRKTAELIALTSDAVFSNLAPGARQPKQLRSAARRA
jgi:hypothetical protein